jgi:hypothetical protein
MPLTLQLPDDLEERLEREAERRGVDAATLTTQLLELQLPPKRRPSRIGALRDEWARESDPEEQAETGRYLIEALDRDRPSSRRLFPPELKGVTW